MIRPFRMRKWGPGLPAALTALAVIGLLAALGGSFFSQQRQKERLQMEYISQTVASETFEALIYQMEKTRVLEGHLIETGGSYDTFAPIARRLLEERIVRSLVFAPGGIVRGVFPLEGNEELFGLDLNSDGLGNLEAQAAIEKGELFIAGPFELVEGGVGICGRLPVYLPDETGEPEYWGLVTVTLDYPAVFAGSPIRQVNKQGYACRVWRINPDDGREQTILETARPIPPGAAVMTRELTLFNARWTIWMAPLTQWYQRLGFWLTVSGGLFISLLAGVAVYSAGKMRELKREESAWEIRNLQQQLEREQTNMLLSQISSHFFYHTLNALQALIVLKPDAAYKMAGDFARYLRFNLDTITAEGGVVSFKEELRAVRAYVDINREQLGDRLQVVYGVRDVDFKIPALTVQPVVENAILHGIKPKVGGGTVRISLTEEAAAWRIAVEDDGVGFDPAGEGRSGSVGLANLRRRIAQFPDCRLEIRSAPGEGTKVFLTVPKNLEGSTEN